MTDVGIRNDSKVELSMSDPSVQPTVPPNDIHALVVDDEPANRDFLVRLLQQAKLEVHGAGSGKRALEIMSELGDSIKLVMLDRQLPDGTGIEILESIRQKFPDVVIVMATMHDERAMIREAFEKGCNAFLVKPHGFMELYRMVAAAREDVGDFQCLDGLIFDHYGKRQWRGY
ncbi:MAG: hypothetical protein CUN55_07790 [Phototrophicales bacterium]|nr:MAG: hypothetical protein CUN55_07790 [Phototrophicales bacterium]